MVYHNVEFNEGKDSILKQSVFENISRSIDMLLFYFFNNVIVSHKMIETVRRQRVIEHVCAMVAS